jgi:preprotein translocase subunit SecD
MLEYARWKYLVALLVLAFGVLYAMPNVFPQEPAVQVTANRGSQVDDALLQRVEAALKQASVAYATAGIGEDGNLLVRTADGATQAAAADAIRAEVGSRYVVALNQASTVPAWLEAIRARPMFLGLDLRGGVHFTMQVDRQAALTKRFEATAEDLRVLLRDNRIAYTSVEPRADGAVLAVLSRVEDAAQAQTLIARDMPTYRIDTDGNRLAVRIPQAELDTMLTEAVQQNIGTLNNRINELGVAEPIIQRQGADRVVVQLPGVQDTAQAKRILGATATLEFRGVSEQGNPVDVASGAASAPPEARLYQRKEIGPDGKPIPILLKKRIIFSGDQLQNATSFFDSQSGTPAVGMRLNSVGGQRNFEYSKDHIGKPMAAVYIERIPEVEIVDGKEVRSTRVVEQVISVATIQSTLGRDFQTTGLESMQESADLALLLRAGALAAPMDFVDERTIGPSLGRENIERGTRAALFAFVFALAFFLVYYRVFGLITCVALLINLLLVIALMSLLGFTLTLPGLAGLALTVAMSVDANVLINERIREELRAGMPPQSAIATGYEKATGTITDSNLTAMLAGIALFAFGTGPLKGFAVTMVIGILTSVFTAVTVSRGIATLIYGGRRKIKSIAI